ncbi:MAG: hypothetical protein P8123_06340 [bacterium]
MKVKSFSKSGYQLFRKCPYLCDQVRNKGLKRKVGPSALNGLEIHRLYHHVGVGKLSYDGAFDKASNEEVREQFHNAMQFDVDFVGERHHEIKLSLRGLSAPTTAILDYVVIDGEYADTIWVFDLKTGFDETPSIPEMDIYALAVHDFWPNRNRIIFGYLFTRTLHSPRFSYWWPDKHRVHMLGPNNFQRDLISTDGREPLRAKVQSYITEMEQSDARPTPGPHCEMMWGEPCQLLGNGCPISPDLAETFNAPMPEPEQELIAANIMRLPEEKRPGAAFLLLHHGYPVEQLPANVISYAYAGLMQVRGGASRVAADIRAWANAGRTFSVGKATYGMRPARVTDVEQALKLLAENDVPTEDLAKVVSLSKSSLEKLPKRKYGQLGTQIADACVYYAEGKEFGKL